MTSWPGSRESDSRVRCALRSARCTLLVGLAEHGAPLILGDLLVLARASDGLLDGLPAAGAARQSTAPSAARSLEAWGRCGGRLSGDRSPAFVRSDAPSPGCSPRRWCSASRPTRRSTRTRPRRARPAATSASTSTAERRRRRLIDAASLPGWPCAPASSGAPAGWRATPRPAPQRPPASSSTPRRCR